MNDDDDEETLTKPARKPPIRTISRISGGPWVKLKKATCFPEVDRRLRLGWSAVDLATMIQDEYGECKDITKSYLRRMIDEYRKSIPSAELAMSSPNSLMGQKAMKAVSDGLNELAELEKLYKLQSKRIMMGVSNEEKTTFLFPATGKEVFIAMKILKQSADLKMDLGLIKRQIGSMEITGALAAEASDRYGKDSIGKVIADPDSRRKVLSMAERLFQLGAKASIDAIGIVGQAVEAEKTKKAERNIIEGKIAEKRPEQDVSTLSDTSDGPEDNDD